MSFIFKITTTTSPQTFVIPCVNTGTFNATVDYGDGTGSQTVTAYNDANLTHSFATAGQHTITIDGTFPNVNFQGNATSSAAIDEVVDLGDVGWATLYGAFNSCNNLTSFTYGTADTSSVTSMRSMFGSCSSLTSLNLSGIDTSNVNTMRGMFYNCSNLTTLDVSGFDTSSVTTMDSMFRGCRAVTTLDVSSFNTSSVNNMGSMFNNCNNLTTLDLSSFDTSNAPSFYAMFYNCNNLTGLDLSNFDTSSATSMKLMFHGCTGLTSLDVSNFNTSNVTTMQEMFKSCNNLTALDLSNFNTSSVNNMEQMFYSCISLTTLDVSNFDTSNVVNFYAMFRGCSIVTNLDVSSFNTSSVISMAYMFFGCTELLTVDLSSFNTPSLISTQGMFYNCSKLTTLDLSNFNTPSINNTDSMFRGCRGLTTLDISNFDTSNVIKTRNMFHDCSSLTTLDMSNFDTSSLADTSYMFSGCTSLTNLNVSSFDTSNVTQVYAMFFNCSSLTTLDVSSFNTSSVTTMGLMFYNCSSLTSLDLSNFNTSSVTTFHEMIRGCSSLTTLDVSNFNTSSVTTMHQMFFNCSSLTTLDLSNFDTSSVTFMSLMFFGCSSLTNLDIKHFNISNVTVGNSFLQNANNALTTTQYDELLEAWAVQDVQPNVSWHFGNVKHTVETIAGWDPRGNSSLSSINNKLVSTATTTSDLGVVQQVDNLIIGSTYVFKGQATCSNSSATVKIRIGLNAVLSYGIYNAQRTGSITVDHTFVATATTHWFGTIVQNHAVNDTVTIDAGITVKEIENHIKANAASDFEYSQEIVFGSNVIPNGGFDTDSDWLFTVPESFSIVNGVCEINHTSSSWGRLRQDNIPIGSYLLTFDLVIESGSLFSIQGTDLPRLALTSSGSYSFVCNTTSTSIHFGFAVNPTVGSIDNISFKPITNAVIYKNIPQSAREDYKFKADSWTGSNELVVNGDFSDNLSGWSETKTNQITTVVDGVCVIDSNGSSDSGITQNMALTLGKTYVLTFDTKFLSNFVAKKLTIYCGPYYDIVDIIDGKQEIVIKPTVTNYFAIRGTNAQTGINAIFSIANVSVKEVIEVEPIFTIDSLFINNEQGIWFDMGKE